MDVPGVFDPGEGRRNGDRRQRLALLYLATVFVIIVVYTMLYSLGMSVLEGRPRGLFRSLVVVIESMTTTGYGEDAPWSHPLMNLYVVFIQLSGFVVIVAALPVFLAPWMQDRLSTTAPTHLPTGTSGHVVIAGYTSRARALITELSARDIDYVVVERDRARAADLYEQRVEVIHGDPEQAAFCREAACLADARALVVDIGDETNASVALTAKQVCDVPVITFVEEESLAEYHRLAGADHVFSPRHLIGESLATKVTARITTELDDAIEVGDDFDIVELPVQPDSDLDGTTIRQSGISERTGASVVGAWFRGEFVSPPSPATRIDSQTILLVAGHEAQLEQLKELTLSEKRRRDRAKVVIAGYGVVGSTVREAIGDTVPVTTVDIVEKPGVDIVGDVTETSVLERAGIDDTTTVILALSNDTMTVFATLVVREMEPDAEIIARADATESVPKVYQAGADYVLSLATVSGRMLASTILGEDVLSFDRQVEVIRTSPGAFAGRSLIESDIRARTGCTVVAIERDGSLVADFDADMVLRADDELIVTGTDADINRFAALAEAE